MVLRCGWQESLLAMEGSGGGGMEESGLGGAETDFISILANDEADLFQSSHVLGATQTRKERKSCDGCRDAASPSRGNKAAVGLNATSTETRSLGRANESLDRS